MCPLDQGATVAISSPKRARDERAQRSKIHKEDTMNLEVTARTPRRAIATTHNYRDADVLADESFADDAVRRLNGAVCAPHHVN
jgi:hypothetical protein